jgi:hypothetical protein
MPRIGKSEEYNVVTGQKPSGARPLGTPLYHYTSVETFQKIYETKTLHATNVGYMNDGSEIRVGLKVLQQVIEDQYGKETGRTKDLLESLGQLIWAREQAPSPIYMLCFSEHRNMLGQWRGYTPLGRGVCIGFNHMALVPRSQRAKWSWLACCYDAQEHQQWMTAYLGRFIREAGRLPQATPANEAAEQTLSVTLDGLYACAAHVKHDAFWEEAEWRLVSPTIPTQSKEVRFRTGRYSLVPYVEFDLTDETDTTMPLSELIVGPTPHPLASVHSVMSMQLSTRPADHVRVTHCEIPYRDV